MDVILQAGVHIGVAITEQNVGVRRRNTPLADVDMIGIIRLLPGAAATRSNLPVRVGISDHRGLRIARLERAVSPPVTVQVRIRRVVPTPRCDGMGFHDQEEAVIADTSVTLEADFEGVGPFGFQLIIPWPPSGEWAEPDLCPATSLAMSTKA